jgi:hypothetical protein
MRLSLTAATHAMAIGLLTGAVTFLSIGCGEMDGGPVEGTSSSLTVTTTLSQQQRVWGADCRPSIATTRVPARITLTPSVEDGKPSLRVTLDSPGSATVRYTNCGMAADQACADVDRPISFILPLDADGSLRHGQLSEKANGNLAGDRQATVNLDRDLLTLDLGVTVGSMGADFACNDPGFQAQGSVFLAEDAAAALYGQLAP